MIIIKSLIGLFKKKIELITPLKAVFKNVKNLYYINLIYYVLRPRSEIENAGRWIGLEIDHINNFSIPDLYLFEQK